MGFKEQQSNRQEKQKLSSFAAGGALVDNYVQGRPQQIEVNCVYLDRTFSIQ